ncbi:MAG: 2'-5' RNA ligase family protein [Bacteroidales bacterium]|jgi:hypothetical protein|nr:2'-5' RNA ligase family protein [Bacteroidales bacterium]
MAYAVISYPDLSKSDFAMIQDFRKDHDEWLYTVVAPHFSFVFPVFDFGKEDFTDEILKLTEDIRRFDFVIRCSTINKDSFSDYFHAFLVPDEGYSNIVKLHDKLYSGKLQNNLRLDIDFIPHIGIGNSKNQFKCKQMADEWNGKDFAIYGSVSRLTIVEFKENKVTDLQDILLG